MSMCGRGAEVGRAWAASEAAAVEAEELGDSEEELELGELLARRDEAWKKRVLDGWRRHWRHPESNRDDLMVASPVHGV